MEKTWKQLETLKSLTQKAAATLLGKSGRWLRDSKCPRNMDGSYCGPDVVAWRVAEASQPAAPSDEDDPMMLEAGSSRALEEYRREKARQVKRQNDIEEGKLLDAAEVTQQLLEIARQFRSESEILERSHGSEIGDHIRQMVDRVECKFKEIFETKGSK